MCTVVYSPTEEKSVPIFHPSASLQASDHQHGAVRSQTHEASPSPTTHRKKPIPLPRKRGLLQDSYPQVSSPMSPAPAEFVYCRQETQCPSSMLTASALGIPHSASTSCLTYSLEYSGDYSGGTGDSGVGDIRQKYLPAKKSLDGKPKINIPWTSSQLHNNNIMQRLVIYHNYYSYVFFSICQSLTQQNYIEKMSTVKLI